MPTTYDFKSLSSREFELLSRDLLQAEWRIRLESFAQGRDGGQDFRHALVADDAIIIQCKHYIRSGFSRLLSRLAKEELPKVQRLKPRRYIIVTSLALSPENKCKLVKLFAPFLQGAQDVLGCDDLNNLLSSHPDVESSNFKLWLTSKATLDRVLHNAQLSQTDFEVKRVHSRLRLYVQTACFDRAMEILDKNRVVVISGMPGVGKTTLAEVLLYAHLERGYAPIVIRSDIQEGRKLFHPAANQIFYFDDFLGQSYLGEQRQFLGRNEDLALTRFIEMVSASDNARLVMTTREHILNGACAISERFDANIIRDLKCVLHLDDYTLEQKQLILYNHLYFSDLPALYRRQFLAPDLRQKLLSQRRFNPRVIEWISSPARVRHIPPEDYRQSILETLESPERIWRHAFEHQISDAARSLLVVLASFGSPTDLRILTPAWEALHEYRARRYGFVWSPNALRSAFHDLDGAFLTLAHEGIWFLNPSVTEFVRRVIADSRDYIADLIASAHYCKQIRWLWELRQAPDAKAVHEHLRELHPQFVDALLRTLPAPLDEERDYRLRLPLPIDDPAHVRFRLLIDTVSLDRKRLWPQAEPLAERLIVAQEEETPSHERLLIALAALDELDWDVEPLRARLKAKLLQQLEWDGLEALAAIWSYLKQCSRPDSEQDRIVVETAITRYLREYVQGKGFGLEAFELLDEQLMELNLPPISDPDVNKTLQHFHALRSASEMPTQYGGGITRDRG